MVISTEKTLSFFRVFDLAFFAPGIVLSLNLALLFNQKLDFSTIKVASVEGILYIMVVIGFIYVLGLTNFSMTWLLFKYRIRKDPRDVVEKDQGKWAPFPLLFDEPIRTELILYFWYLRATCLGLASAFGMSFMATGLCLLVQQTIKNRSGDLFTDNPKGIILLLVFDLLVVVFLTIQGINFNKVIEHCLKIRNDEYHAKRRSGVDEPEKQDPLCQDNRSLR